MVPFKIFQQCKLSKDPATTDNEVRAWMGMRSLLIEIECGIFCNVVCLCFNSKRGKCARCCLYLCCRSSHSGASKQGPNSSEQCYFVGSTPHRSLLWTDSFECSRDETSHVAHGARISIVGRSAWELGLLNWLLIALCVEFIFSIHPVSLLISKNSICSHGFFC